MQILIRIWDFVLNLIYPPKCIFCGKVLEPNSTDLVCSDCRANLPYCSKKLICRKCGKPLESYGERELCYECLYRQSLKYDRIVSVFEYSGNVRHSILSYKKYGRRHYARFYAGFMADRLKEEYSDLLFDYIVSTPCSSSRFAERGFDHVELLARYISKKLNVPYIKCLYKTRDTVQQGHLNYEQRLHNLKGSIAVKEKLDLEGKIILLVDDICTTGSTILECSKVLKSAHAKKVYAVTLATTLKRKNANKVYN